MKNFMVSSSLLKSFLYKQAIPTKEELTIILDVVSDQDEKGKFIYLLGVLSRYNPNKGLTNNTHEFYINTLKAYNSILGLSITEEDISDIAYCLYVVQEINRSFSFENVHDNYQPDMIIKIEQILNKANKTDNIIYIIATFRLASAFIGLTIDDFVSYQDTVNHCADFYLKHFNTIQQKYGEIIRV